MFKVNPKRVAEWFLARIQYYKNLDERFGYSAVPNPSLDGIQLVDAIETQLYEALRLVQDNVLNCEDEFDYSFSELFALMANGFGQVSLALLFPYQTFYDLADLIVRCALGRSRCIANDWRKFCSSDLFFFG
ncbi:MAG TPA: hypothetical protein VFC58_02175 [Desulfosporosinus sp.]|nr:hypothetical protein [Desulfosporosinus sp.]